MQLFAEFFFIGKSSGLREAGFPVESGRSKVTISSFRVIIAVPAPRLIPLNRAVECTMKFGPD